MYFTGVLTYPGHLPTTQEQYIPPKSTYTGYRYFNIFGFLIERPVLIASVVFVIWFSLIALISFLKYLPFKKGLKISSEPYPCNDVLYSNFLFVLGAFFGPYCVWLIDPNFGDGYGLILLAFIRVLDIIHIRTLYNLALCKTLFFPILGKARTFFNITLFFVSYATLITYTAYSFDGYLY